MQLKLRLIFFLTVFSFVLLISRFFYWQIIKAGELSLQAKPQHEIRTVSSSYRGKILASDYSILVGQADSWDMYAEPKLIVDANDFSNKLAGFLADNRNDSNLIDLEKRKIYDVVNDKSKSWVNLGSRIDSKLKTEIEAFKLKGIGFDWDESRVYPEGSASAHLLGFVGKNKLGENFGYFGLEGYYNDKLSAIKGFQNLETDLKGVPILFGKSKSTPSFSGADLVTYIDKGIQIIIDRELKNGIEKYGGVGGSIVVMDPKSGGILAMSSYPSYNPQEYWKYSNEIFLNPVISSGFEPGSIFKVITMASGIEAGVINPDTKCDICSSALKVNKYEIQTWNNVYYPDATMTEVLVHSDNVGMAFVAKKMGIKKNYEFLRKFGLGSKTDIDIQGEVSPALRKLDDWSDVDLITSSFGQGIAVTPIQMISAANVIANKGVYVKPKVVKKIVIEGKEYDTNTDKSNVRIISKETAEKVAAMMVEAAKYGESKWTYKKGFGVAGKTGTAQIPIEGHYDNEKTIASFIGFVPYNDPKFIMLVTLHEPKSSPWASETAAPLWYKIAEKLFLHFGIAPEQ